MIIIMNMMSTIMIMNMNKIMIIIIIKVRKKEFDLIKRSKMKRLLSNMKEIMKKWILLLKIKI